jgi:hypothetical protein
MNGQEVAATLEFLELAGIKAHNVHLVDIAPLAVDIALSNFEARPIPLNFYVIIQRIAYTSYQFGIELRGHYSNLVTEFKKARAHRLNYVLF